VLWAVLGSNAAMFAVEVIAGLVAGSASLQADALDFLGDAATTPSVGVAALLVNALSFGLLWACREGDANMRSAWVCTRNDVLAILPCCSRRLVYLVPGTRWPTIMQGAWIVLRQSRHELRISASPAPSTAFTYPLPS
jgi:Co/Zn/Cd efflux system component